MRITFVVASVDNSGGFRVIATYASMLHKRGHSVCVVAPPARRPKLSERLRSWRSGRTSAHQPRGHHLADSAIPVLMLDRYRPVTEHDVPDADIVFATWWETVEWVTALSDKKGVKAHLVQDYEIWGGEKGRINSALSQKIPKITVSKWLTDLLSEEFEQSFVETIPNSVDFEQFFAPTREKQLTSKIGFVYSPEPRKGCDIAIKAIEKARSHVKNLEVVSFGHNFSNFDIPLPSDFAYHPNPPQAKLREYYAQCDAWLFPTRIEGFGLPILEAMACRTPVIGTTAGAAPELISQGGGWLVPLDDVDAMASAIVGVIGLSNSEWQAMSDAAHRTAHAYTWTDAVDLLESAILKMVVTRYDARPSC